MWYGSSTPYHLLAGTITSDGATVALTGLDDCSFGTPCAVSRERYFVELRRPGAAPVNFAGTASLSPNGRFLLLGWSPMYPFRRPPVTLVDLDTGAKAEFSRLERPPYRHAVADDGTTVVSDLSSVGLRSGQTGEVRALRGAVSSSALINAAGTRAFSLGSGGVGVYDISSGTQYAPTVSVDVTSLDISASGELVAFIEGGQLWIARSPSWQALAVYTVARQALSLALSGDGSKIFVVTSDSAILRYDVLTSAVESLVPPTPFAYPAPPYTTRPVLARGGAYTYEAASIPAVSGVKFASGRMWRVIASDSRRITFQVPWDEPEATGLVHFPLNAETESPFESVLIWHGLSVVAREFPTWYTFSPNQIAALHQDFSRRVSPDNPARSRDIIDAYGTGFGPVAPELPLGAAAGSNPLSVVVRPVECGVWQDSARLPADVLFAGLAPGLVGVYQIDVRMPQGLARSSGSLYCGGASGPLSVAP